MDPVIGTLDDIPGAATSGNPLALSSEALLIDGDAADQVTLSNKGAQGTFSWQLSGNDIGYNVYNYTDGFSTFASVAIDGEVAVVVA